ncbi:MAG: alanine racemase [Oscillospiraceae bacterium]|nr:alanine racemase [Oscillospiraceae bacterium]
MEANELIKKHGSPLYVYDEQVLESRITNMINFAEKLKSELNVSKIKMHYSTKANNNLHILKKIKQMGLSIDSMSPVELRLAELAGFDKDDILYVCNNVSLQEMLAVIDKDITICLDSISQVELLGQAKQNISIMVRINPEGVGIGHSDKVDTSGKKTKFGISEENLPELFKVCEKYNIKVIGIHQHLGSLFLDSDIDQFVTGVESLLRIAKTHFKDLEIIDLGGGFGTPYKEDEKELNLDALIDKLKPVLSNFLNEYHMVEFKFEPGRYIPCESGYILGTVNSVKNENNRIWVGTDIRNEFTS